MKKIYNRIFASVAAVLAAVSCIYPFESGIEATDDDKLVVIEGDIIPGDFTYVTLGYVFPLSADPSEMFESPKGVAWVEDDHGFAYHHYGSVGEKGRSVFTINTTTAPKDRKYRLYVQDYETGKKYHTDWLEVNPAPVLDSLTYVVGDDKLDIRISAHSDDGGQFFRWSYDELWKYHAEYVPQYHFDLLTGTEVMDELPDMSTYWCWSNHSCTEVELCATTDLNSNAMVDHSFLTIPRTSPKLMTRYRITVNVRSISESAYRFLHTLQVNSDFVGSLFSPNPSDVRGNIYCDQNPDEYVIGFIDCCAPSVPTTIYINASGIYRYPGVRSIPFVPEIIMGEDGGEIVDLFYYWKSGFVPVFHGTGPDGKTGVLWDLKRCIDCRLDGGGSLQKPLDWKDKDNE